MSDYTPSVKRAVRTAGAYRVRQGRGDHEIQYSPVSGRNFVIDGKIKKRKREEMKAIRIFHSYCHREETILGRMREELALLLERPGVDDWWDRKLTTGSDLEEIMQELERADIVTVMLSSGYLASRSCRKELQRVLRGRRERGVKVVPIVVKRCGWKDLDELAGILATPRDGKPIVEWAREEQAWEHVRKSMKQVIDEVEREKCKGLRPKKRFHEEMNGTEFVNSDEGERTLEDLFIFPEVTKHGVNSHGRIYNLKGLRQAWRPTVITGEGESGKTTLLRKIWSDAWKKGDGAILLDGEQLKQGKAQNITRKIFNEQVEGTWSAWQNREERTVLIDNCGGEIKNEMRAYLEENYKYVVYAMSEDEYVKEVRGEKGIGGYRKLSIGPLTHKKQEQLIRKWLGRNKEGKENVTDQKVDQIEDYVNGIVDRNRIVPRYPFFVLSILQTMEGFMPANMEIHSICALLSSTDHSKTMQSRSGNR